MFTNRLTPLPAVAAVVVLVAACDAQAQPILPSSAAGDYFDTDLDNLYDIDPRNYGYLPRSYEYPWL